MLGFGLLCGHMLGDYILQNDWMARNKTLWGNHEKDGPDWTWRVSNLGHLACTVHCLFYTFAVWACSFWWMPLWGLVVCFVVHWPIDRFRLAYVWMTHVAGQSYFASKEHPMWPNGIILVDNTFHLLTLFGIALVALPSW